MKVAICIKFYLGFLDVWLRHFVEVTDEMNHGFFLNVFVSKVSFVDVLVLVCNFESLLIHSDGDVAFVV